MFRNLKFGEIVFIIFFVPTLLFLELSLIGLVLSITTEITPIVFPIKSENTKFRGVYTLFIVLTVIV